MSTKVSNRTRKQRSKDEETVAQVHKIAKINGTADNDKKEQTDDSSESNRTYLVEDKNENCVRTPSRDVSVDEETQINAKIINLIENEMKRDNNKHTHFSDSRPQSLSFYEDEKIPEELSGNLELLSPEERKHYRRRKEYIDLDLERNVYNNMQDTLNRETEDIILSGSTKKSKSRKKRHSADPDIGLGDSREMMIPKEKRKNKKKKRENSPQSSTFTKKKHRKHEDYEPKSDITLALEDLQDDVFETLPDEYQRSDKTKRSPRRSDKLYVQKKNKFEVVPRPVERGGAGRSILHGDDSRRRFSDYAPLELSQKAQRCWLPFTTLCHGLLGGMAFAHFAYILSGTWTAESEYLTHYAHYSDVYVILFYFFNVVCLISVFDRYDLYHFSLSRIKKSTFGAIVVYLTSLLVHLLTITVDDKIGLMAYNGENDTVVNITDADIHSWSTMSLYRSVFAIGGWVIISLSPVEDSLLLRLKSMESTGIIVE